MNMETLYQMTANYISLLQAKVSLLQSLSTFYGVWYSSTPKKKNISADYIADYLRCKSMF